MISCFDNNNLLIEWIKCLTNCLKIDNNSFLLNWISFKVVPLRRALWSVGTLSEVFKAVCVSCPWINNLSTWSWCNKGSWATIAACRLIRVELLTGLFPEFIYLLDGWIDGWMDAWMDGWIARCLIFAAGAVFVQQTEPLSSTPNRAHWLDLTDVNTEWKPQISDRDSPD